MFFKSQLYLSTTLAVVCHLRRKKDCVWSGGLCRLYPKVNVNNIYVNTIYLFIDLLICVYLLLRRKTVRVLQL